MREYFNFMIIVIVIKFVRRLNILHSQVPNCRGGGKLRFSDCFSTHFN